MFIFSLFQNEMDVFVDPNILAIFEEATLENAQNSTKQIRYLENADLHLEKVKVSYWYLTLMKYRYLM